MKLTKPQLKRVIKEVLSNEDLDQIMHTLKPYFSHNDDNRKIVDKNVAILQAKIDRLKMGDIHKLHQRFRELNGDVQKLEDDVLTINDKLSIEKPSRFAAPEVVRGKAKPTTDTNPGGRRPPEEGTVTQLEQIIRDEVEKIVKKSHGRR